RVLAVTNETLLSGQMRRFHYHRAAMIQFLSVGVGSVLALVLAYVAPGPFVFVVRDAGPPALVAVVVGGWAVLFDRQRTFGFDGEAARAVWQLGRSLFATRLLEVLYARIDQLAVGAIAGKDALGYYHQARYLFGLPGAAMGPAINGVGLRTFAALHD